MTTTSQPTTTTPDQRLRLPELVAYRAAATTRRAAAFCDAPEYVLGIEVMPLTPRTFSMLVAVGSHFVLGGQPTEGDVRNYLWFHSRAWCHCGVAGWQRRKAAALAPLAAQLDNPWRRRLGLRREFGRYGATMVLASSEISALLDEAFADCPAAGNAGNSGPSATLEAQLINQFAIAYHWPPEATRNMPLRQLMQLVRAHRAYHGDDVKDAGEQAILAAHLQRRQAQLDKEAHANG